MKLKFVLFFLILITIILVGLGFTTLNRVNNIQTKIDQMVVEPGDEISDIHFYNLKDEPPVKPYMSIFFKNLSPSDWRDVERWHDEMIVKLRELGGVHTKGDYEKITPIVKEYSAKFVKTQANYIAIEFPREGQGILIVNKEKVKK